MKIAHSLGQQCFGNEVLGLRQSYVLHFAASQLFPIQEDLIADTGSLLLLLLMLELLLVLLLGRLWLLLLLFSLWLTGVALVNKFLVA